MSRRAAWVGLVLVLVLDLWLRGHTFGPSLGLHIWPATGAEAEPLDCDECAYGYIGRRIVDGAVMYRDLTENKPPGGYWLYALAVAVGGPDELTIRILPIPLVLATIALVWWLGLRLAGPAAAVLGAFLFAVLSTDPYLFGNGANLEHAINLAATAALACLVAAWDRPGRRRIAAGGACLGLACLVKQVAILHAPIFAAALLIRPGRGRPARLGDLAALAGGFAAVWAVAIGVLVLQGAGPAAFEDIVRYGGALAADTPADPKAPPALVRWFTGNADPRGRLPWPFGRTDYLVWWGTGSWPAWLAAIPALGWLLRGRTPGGRTLDAGPRRLAAAWTLSAWVQVAMPGLFWQHYYLLPTPGVALAVGVLAGDALAALRSRTGPGRGLVWGLALAAVLLAVGETFRIQWRAYLARPPRVLTEEYKGGKQWVVLRSLGRELRRRSAVWDDPKLHVWGWQSPLYFYGGLDGVTPQFFVDPLLKAFPEGQHPQTRPRLERLMADLKSRPPELIFCGDPPFPALRAFLDEHYLPSAVGGIVVPDGRGLWVEKGKYLAFETFAGPSAQAGVGERASTIAR